MGSRTVYGLDIEIDRDAAGNRDPEAARIVAVALACPGSDELFTGGERRLLRELDERLHELPAGVLATWQGSTFDLPFLAERSARAGVVTGLRLRRDPSLPATQRPLVGHEGAYRAAWYEHQHIDACRVCNGELVGPGPLSGVWRSFLAFIGSGPTTVVGDRVDDVRSSPETCDIANDARLTRALIDRRLPSVRRHLDRVPLVRESAHLALVPTHRARDVTSAVGGEHAGPAVASA